MNCVISDDVFGGVVENSSVEPVVTEDEITSVVDSSDVSKVDDSVVLSEVRARVVSDSADGSVVIGMLANLTVSVEAVSAVASTVMPLDIASLVVALEVYDEDVSTCSVVMRSAASNVVS